jgi:hypothetical protein
MRFVVRAVCFSGVVHCKVLLGNVNADAGANERDLLRGDIDAGPLEKHGEIEPRFELDRNGLLQTQSTFAPHRSPNLHRHVRCYRPNLRSLLTGRVLELLQGRRIYLRLKAGCFGLTSMIAAAGSIILSVAPSSRLRSLRHRSERRTGGHDSRL